MSTRPLALALLTACVLTALHSEAAAQSNTFEAGSLVIQSAPGKAQLIVRDQAVLPGYWDLGTSVRFSSPTTEAAGLSLPSIVRIGVNGRLSISKSFELSGGVALPPKQDEVTEDPALFDGVLMGRLAISRNQSLYALTTAKRLLQLAGPRDDGVWSDVALGWNGRSFMDLGKQVGFSWHLGGNGGRAFRAAESPWLAEAVAGLGLSGALIENILNLTAGADFHFPIASGGRAYWVEGAPTINPQTRADLYVRMAVQMATGWQVSGSFILSDRGQVSHPETILPTLEGGYDQTTFVIGFTYRGIRKPAEERDRYATR